MLAKRLFDLFSSLVGLILLMPILSLVALLIKIDSKGPVIFKQKRLGKGGLVFNIYKFRTMKQSKPGSQSLTIKNDPRVTRMGKKLRKMKLDELPQLFNVVRGEMSLVGPRPESIDLIKYWPIQSRIKIQSIRPGITDNASIIYKDESKLLRNGHDAIERYRKEILPKKIKLYEEYIDSRSFLNDIKIILQTLLKIIQ
tara:strand:- start:869 stop:1462 length:594 start_codon:yes stop_codon:yes gene_type:complete